jgi:hypothetical protein
MSLHCAFSSETERNLVVVKGKKNEKRRDMEEAVELQA